MSQEGGGERFQNPQPPSLTPPSPLLLLLVENISVIKSFIDKAFPSGIPIRARLSSGGQSLDLIKDQGGQGLALAEIRSEISWGGNTINTCCSKNVYLRVQGVSNLPNIVTKAREAGASVSEDGRSALMHAPDGSFVLLLEAAAEGGTTRNRLSKDDVSASAGINEAALRGEARLPLRVKLLRVAEPREILPNAPIRLENEFFVGQMLFLLRQDPLEPRYAHMFMGKQRKFIIQVQGRFKVKLRNPYFGGEITSKRMELGLLAMGMARTILSFIKAINSEMHSSFGDAGGLEAPHITVPLWKASETFLITPPGEEPPSLEANFPTGPEDKLRRGGKLPPHAFDTVSTYSFSFHSMFIDFLTWRVTGFPLINSLDLHLMWANAALRFVVYEPDFEDSSGFHRQSRNKYIYLLELQHASNEAKGRRRGETVAGHVPVAEDGLASSSSSGSQSGSSLADDGDDASEDAEYYDAQPGSLASQKSFTFSFGSRDEAEGIDVEDEEDDEDEYALSTSAQARTPLSMPSTPSSTPFWLSPGAGGGQSLVRQTTREEEKRKERVSLTSLLGTRLDEPLVPAWIEVIDRLSGSKAKRKVLYCFALKDRCILRCSKLVRSTLGFLASTPPSPRSKHNPRYSDRNVERLVLAGLFQRALDRASEPRVQAALEALVFKAERRSKKPDPDRTYLSEGLILDGFTTAGSSSSSLPTSPAQALGSRSGGGGGNSSTSPPPLPSPTMYKQSRPVVQGPVGRGLGDHHFVEEYAVLTRMALHSYVRARDACGAGGKAKLTIPIRDIVGTRVLPLEESPCLPGFSFFEVEVLGRVWTFMTRTESEASAWVNEIKNVISLFDDPRESRKNIQMQHPCKLIMQVLEYAFLIDSSSSVEELVAFLDSASALKHVQLSSLSDGELKAFLLNLYHLMVLHARLLLGGPPLTAIKWCSYFNLASYECGGDVFSLSELEHCIIRARMPKPRSTLVRWVIPSTRYALGLEPDYRINFALNCGSISLPPSVPIFTPEHLDKQLDMVSSMVLDSAVRIDLKGKTLLLPKMLQWYQQDFEVKGGLLLLAVAKHLHGSKAAALRQLLHDTGGGKTVVYKYQPFSFETRALSRYEDG